MEMKCPICQNDAESHPIVCRNGEKSTIEIVYECPHCGVFQLPSVRVLDSFEAHNADNIFNLRCYMNEKGNKNTDIVLRLNSDELERVSEEFPKSIDDKINKILSFIERNTLSYGDNVPLTPEVSYSKKPNELICLLDDLQSKGLIHANKWINGNASASLTKDGFDFIKSKKINVRKEYCFVAMWFDPSMAEIWEKVLKPACEETGYQPIRVDKVQFNDDINNHIITLIEDSFFMIADLTGFRGGVYYEAGFARGLGKEVILCCKDKYSIKIKYDAIDKEVIENGPHFDVNHLNTIYWKSNDLEDYKERLKNRIIGTVGRGSYSI